jgi:hypothetical protein
MVQVGDDPSLVLALAPACQRKNQAVTGNVASNLHIHLT